MPVHIPRPTRIQAAGSPPKTIEEYVGRVNTDTEALSIARMLSPAGWSEPGQRPDFDEFTVVLRGELHVESENGEALRVRDVIPGLLEIGMEVLNPVQWVCPGMDREGLKRDFGGRLVFHGAVDNQHTLPFGSTDDVRGEVIDNLRILGGENGRYILGPCHNIQAVSPPENVVALYETGYAEGWF